MSGKKYLVYKHTNKVNGLVYIGITCQKPNARWKNGKGYKPGKDENGNEKESHFWNAIQKYGWDGFDHLVLVRGLTEEEAKWLEIQLIAAYDSTDREKGYNVSKGGDTISEETRQKISESNKGLQAGEKHPMYGKHHTEEAKQKMSDAKKGEKSYLYGEHRSEETKQKISEAQKGEKNHMYGKHHTEEARQKMSESRKGEKHYLYGKTGKDHNSSKTVICITTRQVYYGTYEAERATGAKHQSISRVCNGKGKSAGKLPDGTKLKWRYVKDLPKPKVPKDIKQLLRNGPKPLKIVC